ncbi:lipid A deacylase LpxR family protein [Pontiellaceae bacterium B1224]|nr:lipid A deacylase LpxR family protein [Pontiellaceae bacterium B1224]
MKFNIQRQIVMGISFLMYCGVGEAGAETETNNVSVESATWQFEFDNDIFFRKDNKISSGWAFQRHSAVAESWNALHIPRFAQRVGAAIPTLTKEGLVYRMSIAVGQVLQTPDDLTRTDLIEDDVPYAGALTMQSSWYAFNDETFRGFEVTVGVVGPLSGAEQTQKIIHEIFGSDDPQGWDNQLSNEPVINFAYMRKKKMFRIGNPAGISFDTSINGDVGLGNLFTQAGASLELRFGRNMPGGFLFYPDPIGLGMNYKASLKPKHPARASVYATFALCGNVFAHNIFLDGNTFEDSHSVEKEPLVGQVVGGLHYLRSRWGVHFYMIASSNNVDKDSAPAAEPNEGVGSLIIEWRF